MSRKSYYEGGRRINDRSPGDGVKVGGSIYNGIILLPPSLQTKGEKGNGIRTFQSIN